MIVLDDYLDKIQEAKKTSVTKITRQTKIARALGQLASVEARKAGDPMYDKMKHYKKLYKKFKKLVHKKYAPKVRSRARK